MPLSAQARRKLHYGLANRVAADNIADVIDAGSGTITANSKRRLVFGLGNRKAANLLETAVNAGTAINGYTQRHLANIVGSGVADEIDDALTA